MKFMVGYQLMESDGFMQAIIRNKEHIYEVYFSWADMPNGRNTIKANENFLPWEAVKRQEEDLSTLAKNKINLNLLLNANCYGKYSQSRCFYNEIGDLVNYISEEYGLHSVTTTSPLIAKFIKSNFPQLDIKASVNMEIGTIQGMDYLNEYFDSYYMKREYNRDVRKIIELKDWCTKNQKKLFLLANSGCLNNCSVRQFHDNLVAHENEIKEMDNAIQFRGICREYLNKREKQISVIRDTSFIRPEDMAIYDQWFTAAKLATRVSLNPIRTLEAYVNGGYSGNVLELLEPNYTDILYPNILENKKIPDDFIEKVLYCNKNCSNCEYCNEVYNKALVRLDYGGIINVNQ